MDLTGAKEMADRQIDKHTEKLGSGRLDPLVEKMQNPGSLLCLFYMAEQQGRVYGLWLHQGDRYKLCGRASLQIINVGIWEGSYGGRFLHTWSVSHLDQRKDSPSL